MKNIMKNIEQLEFIHDCIIDECQEYLYYEPALDRKIYQKFKNAADLILNNAMRILRNQKPMIKPEIGEFTIEDSKNLMFKIYQMMLMNDFPITKETLLKKIIVKEFHLDPNQILIPNPNQEVEYMKALKILNA